MKERIRNLIGHRGLLRRCKSAVWSQVSSVLLEPVMKATSSSPVDPSLFCQEKKKTG